MAARKRRVHPQFVILELILGALCTAGALLLAGHLGAGHGVALFLAGMVADRVVTVLLRYRNKPLLSRRPAPRRTPARRPAARRS